jgi:hypothetical protein
MLLTGVRKADLSDTDEVPALFSGRDGASNTEGVETFCFH